MVKTKDKISGQAMVKIEMASQGQKRRGRNVWGAKPHESDKKTPKWSKPKSD